jgi:hypothetical protein
MKRALGILFLFCAACGGAPDSDPSALIDYDGPTVDAPDFAGFTSDEERDRYCAHSNSFVCNADDGDKKTEAWVSSYYYGIGSNGPCYNGPSGEKCYFPKFKRLNFRVATGDIPASVSITEYAALQDGFVSGIKSLNGVASGVTVQQVTSGADTTVRGYFASEEDGSLGMGGFEGLAHTQIANLPGSAGPAVQIDGKIARFSAQALKNFVVNTCHLAGTTANLFAFAQYDGIHEGLHALGFDHFTTGIMKTHQQCNERGIVAPSAAFKAALAHYDGSASGATVLDDGLAALGPTP